jgi:hypothetical protein
MYAQSLHKICFLYAYCLCMHYQRRVLGRITGKSWAATLPSRTWVCSALHWDDRAHCAVPVLPGGGEGLFHLCGYRHVQVLTQAQQMLEDENCLPDNKQTFYDCLHNPSCTHWTHFQHTACTLHNFSKCAMSAVGLEDATASSRPKWRWRR